MAKVVCILRISEFFWGVHWWSVLRHSSLLSFFQGVVRADQPSLCQVQLAGASVAALVLVSKEDAMLPASAAHAFSEPVQLRGPGNC